MHKSPPEVDFESSRSPASLEIVPVCIVVRCVPHDNIADIHLYDECTRLNAKRLSQDFVHFVTARASLLTDHKISRCPARCAILSGQWLKNGVSCSVHVHAFQSLSRSRMCI